jgi:transcriptional regulator with XRE-family HTH domain
MSSKLRQRVLDSQPGLRASHDANMAKRNLAMALRSLRIAAGLTQEQLGERAGISQSHLSRIEAATGPMPTNDTIARYAAACDAKPRLEFVPKDQPDNMADNSYISVAMLA